MNRAAGAPTSCRYTNGGQTTQAAGGCAAQRASSSSIRRAFSAREPCIFQFPATMGRRMTGLERP